MPLKSSALPFLPVVAQVVFVAVPELPLPDESFTVLPLPSLKPQLPRPPPSPLVKLATWSDRRRRRCRVRSAAVGPEVNVYVLAARDCGDGVSIVW
jgi:hypothetical protein